LGFRGRAGLEPPSQSGFLNRFSKISSERRKDGISGSAIQTVGLTQMKGIWKKYKVWLLIWLFYTAFWLVKGIQMLKSVDPQIDVSDHGHSNQSCG
jgi:hypothetical protein